MSINHFSSDLPEAHWWSHYLMLSSSSSSPPPPPPPPHNPPITSSSLSPHTFWLSPAAAPPMFNSAVPFDLNNDDDDDQFLDEQLPADNLHHDLQIPKERLFEKPLTPSDVGKLNRLVIPKQHAEKHFPLNAAADSGENGLLLGFEDELGKSWRFRYSYWNSSQSYVLTKGWSRFVKEKRLDAGDVVVFARHRADAGRLFIGWRRRNSLDGGGTQAAANGGGWSRVVYSGHPNYQIQQQGQGAVSTSLSYQPENVHAGVQNQTTTSVNGNSKRLRLFGVNMECQTADDSEPSTPVGSPMSSQQHQHQHHPYYQQQYYTSNHHMDISFSGAAADVYRQG